MHESIIDTPHLTTPSLSRLSELGVKTIIRYYTPANFRSKFPNKRLTPQEAEAIAQHGMTIIPVHQANCRDMADFAAGKGASDARSALANAAGVGQAEGTAIYFSVDLDVYPPSRLDVIEAYFREIQSELAGRYRIGVYGSGGVCQRLSDKGLVEFTWLPKSLGWFQSRPYFNSNAWSIYQNRHDVKLANGFAYDSNLANPHKPGIGDFSLAGAAPLPVDHTVINGERHEVIARTGLNLRSGPGETFARLIGLPPGAIVVVHRRVGEWAQIDCTGDGLVDGFVHASYLRPLFAPATTAV